MSSLLWGERLQVHIHSLFPYIPYSFCVSYCVCIWLNVVIVLQFVYVLSKEAQRYISNWSWAKFQLCTMLRTLVMGVKWLPVCLQVHLAHPMSLLLSLHALYNMIHRLKRHYQPSPLIFEKARAKLPKDFHLAVLSHAWRPESGWLSM